MSGHSKWAQIKRQKGVADIKKGQVFTKLANAITIAVRDSGGIGDPEKNFKLRLIIEKSRAVNMPKENIERAIEKGQGKGKGEELAEVVYEGFGPQGVSIIVEATTDNKLRTNSEVKNVLDKNGGHLGSQGSVSYQFEKKGQITVNKNGKTLDEIFFQAADAGAEDVEEIGDQVLIYTKPEELSMVKQKLTGQLSVTDAEITRKPFVVVSISDKSAAQKILSLMEKLEALDDVQKVYANFDIPDEILKETE